MRLNKSETTESGGNASLFSYLTRTLSSNSVECHRPNNPHESAHRILIPAILSSEFGTPPSDRATSTLPKDAFKS